MINQESGHEIVDKRKKISFTLDNELIDTENISGFAKLVYAVLVRHEGKDRTAWPSTETIAKKAGIHHTPVERAIKELEALHMIVVRRKNGVGNKYIILDKTCWTTPCGSVVDDQSTPSGGVVNPETTPCGSVVDDQSTPSGGVVNPETTPCGSVEGFKKL